MKNAQLLASAQWPHNYIHSWRRLARRRKFSSLSVHAAFYAICWWLNSAKRQRDQATAFLVARRHSLSASAFYLLLVSVFTVTYISRNDHGFIQGSSSTVFTILHSHFYRKLELLIYILLLLPSIVLFIISLLFLEQLYKGSWCHLDQTCPL